MSKTKFPITIKRGNIAIKIHLTPSRGYDSFTVVYYFGGQRQRRTFSDLEQARLEAEVTATKLAEGEMDVLTLTSEDRLAYIRAVDALRPTDTPLEMAALQFAEAHKIMEGGSLTEAARFYIEHNTAKLPQRTVKEVVTELVQTKTQDGMSALYVSDLRLRLTRFADKMKCPISTVTSSQIADFLRLLNVAPRTRNNFRCGISTLFSFAQARGYLPKGETECHLVPKAKGKTGAIQIFTPAQMKKLLLAAEPDLVPFLAIGAFAGLRHQEIKRLDWQQVILHKNSIEVTAANSKTASRRLVPIPPNLKRWLKPHFKQEGHVATFANMTNRFLKLSRKVGVKWHRNVLRHSFISYRLAEVQAAAQVALEAGNSPKMIFEHYRELVFADDAQRWFSIKPKRGAKIISLTPAQKLAA